MLAKDVMSRNVITVKADTSIREIAAMLVKEQISGMPVVDQEDNIIGIVSESDLMHKEMSPRIPDAVNILGAIIFYRGLREYQEAFRKMAATTAAEIMTEHVISVQEDEDISQVGQLMMDHHIKRVPVLAGKKLVGIISRSDMVRMLLTEE